MTQLEGSHHVEVHRGSAVMPFLDDLARLRMQVFRDYPYLYDGSLAYERDYLQTYANSPRSVFVVAISNGKVVGASTAIPLAEETEAVRAPFVNVGISVEGIFYLGESVLLNDHRGFGIGHRFFDAREACARAEGCTTTAFCSVMRADNDSRRPHDHRSNAQFWSKRGYRQRDDLRCRMMWKELGDSAESSHELVFWTRTEDGTR